MTITTTETLQRVRQKAAEARASYERRVGSAEALRAQVDNYTAEAERQEALAREYTEAVALLGTYASDRQASIYAQLESLVSEGLTKIFHEDLRLKVKTKQVGKREDVEFVLVSTYGDVEIETPILGSRGGGVAAVAGLLFRAIMVLLTQSPRLIVLDEAMAQVSAEYEPKVAEFISELADTLAVQFIIVTHSFAYIDFSDTIYTSSQTNGVTTFTVDGE